MEDCRLFSFSRLKIQLFPLAKIGRRKKFYGAPEGNGDGTSANPDAIKNIFAQHIQTSGSTQLFNDMNIPTLKLNLNGYRTTRSDISLSESCQIGFKKLLKRDVIIESLLASSILWRHWNQNILRISNHPLSFLAIEEEFIRIFKQLELIGPWSLLIGRYGANWIRNIIL